MAAPDVVSQVVLDSRRRIAPEGRAHAPSRDASFAIEGVQGVVLGDAGAADLAVVLKEGVDVEGDLEVAALFAGQFLHALSASVVAADLSDLAPSQAQLRLVE